VRRAEVGATSPLSESAYAQPGSTCASLLPRPPLLVQAPKVLFDKDRVLGLVSFCRLSLPLFRSDVGSIP